MSNNQTVAELRGFSPQDYIVGPVSEMAGAQQGFSVQYAMRQLGPVDSNTVLAGNVNTTLQQGWVLLRGPDTDGGATMNFAVLIYEAGGGNVVPFSVGAIVGKTDEILFNYDPVAELITVYANGVFLTSLATTGTPYAVPSQGLNIGYSVADGDGESPETSFVGITYGLAQVDADEAAEVHLEFIKRASVSSAGFNTPRRKAHAAEEQGRHSRRSAASSRHRAHARHAALQLGLPAGSRWSGRAGTTGSARSTGAPGSRARSARRAGCSGPTGRAGAPRCTGTPG
jgi:hypothetical protein